jgi:hypothetical protein
VEAAATQVAAADTVKLALIGGKPEDACLLLLVALCRNALPEIS